MMLAYARLQDPTPDRTPASAPRTSKGRVAANRYTSPDQPVGLERFAQEGKGAAAMPTYVSLISWTDQGVKNYRDTMARADAFRDLLRQAGGQVRELLWTFGEYDVVTVIEAPDDETAMGLLLQTAAQGNVRLFASSCGWVRSQVGQQSGRSWR